MTATPRLYSDDTKSKAAQADAFYALWMMLLYMAKSFTE